MRWKVNDGRRNLGTRYAGVVANRFQLGDCACKGYAIREGVRRGLAGLGAVERVPVLIPISDPRAVSNAIRVFQTAAAQRGQLSGLGVSAQTAGQATSAMQYGAMGAKVGSIIPGIGTVIGFVVGAVVGALLGKKKPPRPSAQQIADCKTQLGEYMQAANENPNTPIPLDEGQLKTMNWCLQAIYGAGDIKNKDPRYFDGNFIDLMAIAKDIVRKIYDTPVGGTVNVSETVNKIRGQTFKSSGITFQNPPFTDLKAFTRDVFTGVAVAYCKQTAGKGSGGCEQFFTRPEYQRLFYDMLGFAARTLLPNISEADLREASKVAAQTGTSASAVVQAVEQIIGKSVQRNETAEILSPGSSTRAPPETAPAPVPITVTPGGTAPATGQPGAGPQSLAPSGLTPSVAVDTRKQIDDLLSAGANQQQAFQQIMQSLTSRGITPTMELQNAVQTEVKAANAPNYLPWIFGVVGAVGVGFMLRKRRA